METQIEQYKPISFIEWLMTLIFTAIPIVGIIMLFVWSFNGTTHPSKANWAKATLLLIAMAVVLLTGLVIIGVNLFSDIFS